MTQEQLAKANQLSRKINELEYSMRKLTEMKTLRPNEIIISDSIKNKDAKLECSKDFCIEVIDAIIEAVSPQIEGLKKHLAEL